MTRILLVSNDYPPRPGGIQSYLEQLVTRMAGEHELTVYAPRWKGSAEYDERVAARGITIVRHRSTLMLPEPMVDARMRALIAERGIETVWFGAAAPLALLADRARGAGARRVVASTHGHEVGWSMLPVAASALRRIGDSTDVITFVSHYTRRRFAAAFGPHAGLEHLRHGWAAHGIDRRRPQGLALRADRIRVAIQSAPEGIDEVWHLTKPRSGNGGWLVAGIQQNG